MPNWVYNYVTATGKPEDLAKFAEKASQPYKVAEDWEEKEGAFFFWNFKKPTNLEAYVAAGDNTLPIEEQLKFAGDNSYDWNIRNWGTKWEACYSEITLDEIANGKIAYKFDTAWAPPIEVFQLVAKQYPELTFEVEWEEEQGWGGKGVGKNGYFSITDQWDIPNCHADFDALDKECDACVGWYPDDPSNWYDDCPRPENDLADKIKQQIIAKTGVSQEWASKHLEVII